MRLGSWEGRCSCTLGAGAPQRGDRGGGQEEQKGGDQPPHMDATLKIPPKPPTPDILSSLSIRGISNLIGNTITTLLFFFAVDVQGRDRPRIPRASNTLPICSKTIIFFTDPPSFFKKTTPSGLESGRSSLQAVKRTSLSSLPRGPPFLRLFVHPPTNHANLMHFLRIHLFETEVIL